MDCNELLEQLSEYLDPEARAEVCKKIEEHLTHCTDCSFYVDSIKKTIVLYQADRQVEVPRAVSSQLQAVLAREYSA